MASNLRAKPLEGHVTDSSGNVLRNTQIVIKQSTPSGSFSVDLVRSDESGYFVTKPLKSGTYDIYESGALISKAIHSPGPLSLQSYRANPENYNPEDLESFSTLSEEQNLNAFKTFIQIEQEDIDVVQYGSSFPIYDFDISVEPGLSGIESELYNLSQFYNLDSNSRITTTRFDVEYFNPLTGASSTYKRIRWCGVPAIRFRKDSKLLLPLDYYSIVLNHPKLITPSSGDFAIVITAGTPETMELQSSNADFITMVLRTRLGDILKVIVDDEPWYGIVTLTGSTASSATLSLEKFKSSRFTSLVDPSSLGTVSRILSFDGMFQNISEINDEAGERFTVVENIYAQGLPSEMYNYNYQ